MGVERRRQLRIIFTTSLDQNYQSPENPLKTPQYHMLFVSCGVCHIFIYKNILLHRCGYFLENFQRLGDFMMAYGACVLKWGSLYR